MPNCFRPVVYFVSAVSANCKVVLLCIWIGPCSDAGVLLTRFRIRSHHPFFPHLVPCREAVVQTYLHPPTPSPVYWPRHHYQQGHYVALFYGAKPSGGQCELTRLLYIYSSEGGAGIAGTRFYYNIPSAKRFVWMPSYSSKLTPKLTRNKLLANLQIFSVVSPPLSLSLFYLSWKCFCRDVIKSLLFLILLLTTSRHLHTIQRLSCAKNV